MKQSFCYPCFRQPDQSLAELFREAASIGYAATELWSPDEGLEEFVDTARSAGLAVASFTGHDSIDHGLNDPEHWERIEDELVRSIDRAAALKIPGIICFSGTRRPGLSDAYGLALFIKGARRVVRHAEERGVNLNLEVLNSRVDHPHYMADTVDWAIAACEAVASPRMRLLFDVYHVQIMEGDLIRALRRAAPYLGHVHTAGNPGRHEMDDDQEINYRAIGRELDRLGYDGYVGHELFAKGDRMAALRSSFEAM
ncbi:hydroxypyruvate isomerase family protein [Fimbriimonas ginsengisoli]|uniref:Xylose isomerase domain protein TIM barrel n=1 Tax=Fimbriimonas ginsengisoli Gsoil 348 TaxID=661478 RepID=A0A068NJL5_FIMGI|nr:TIM barrel protein [Fimbriimonas ginsengisoli]AIE83808.1 Xylose isomerase domain protein TIM barrel [Fimbriimonas ginsengisoli Gsoil 348]